MKKKEYVGVKYPHVKKNLKDVSGKGYEGVVYTYTLNKPGDAKHGWKYVGVTPEERVRRRKWGQESNPYAGKKIADARQKYGIGKGTWQYAVEETIYDQNIDNLVDRLNELENKYITKYNSVDQGFNGNAGGTGRKGQKISQDEIDRRKAARGDFHHSDEAKQKISDAMKNREVTLDTRKKISKGNTGKKRTPEQNKAHSDRMKGIEPKAASEAAKKWREENGGSYWKGKKLSADAKAKIKAIQQERGTSVRVTFPDGHTEDFTTMLDASKRTGDGPGSVKYSIEHGSTTKRGYKYVKL